MTSIQEAALLIVGAALAFSAVSPRVPTGFFGAIGCLMVALGGFFALDDYVAITDYYFTLTGAALMAVQFVVNGVMRRNQKLYERLRGHRARRS